MFKEAPKRCSTGHQSFVRECAKRIFQVSRKDVQEGAEQVFKFVERVYKEVPKEWVFNGAPNE